MNGRHALLVCLVGQSSSLSRTHACYPRSIGPPLVHVSEPPPLTTHASLLWPSSAPCARSRKPARRRPCAITGPEPLTTSFHMTGSEMALLKRPLNEAIEEVNRRAEELWRWAEHAAKSPRTVPQIGALKA